MPSVPLLALGLSQHRLWRDDLRGDMLTIPFALDLPLYGEARNWTSIRRRTQQGACAQLGLRTGLPTRPESTELRARIAAGASLASTGLPLPLPPHRSPSPGVLDPFLGSRFTFSVVV